MGTEIPVSWGLDCRESKASEVADWRTFAIFVRPKKVPDQSSHSQ